MSERDELLGRLALERGFVTPKQLEGATRACAAGARLGQVLVERCLLTREQLADLLAEQRDRRVTDRVARAVEEAAPQQGVSAAEAAPMPAAASAAEAAPMPAAASAAEAAPMPAAASAAEAAPMPAAASAAEAAPMPAAASAAEAAPMPAAASARSEDAAPAEPALPQPEATPVVHEPGGAAAEPAPSAAEPAAPVPQPAVAPPTAPSQPGPQLRSPETPEPAAAPARAAEQAARPEERLPDRESPVRCEALDALLSAAMERGASDLHVHTGAAVQVRLHGALAAQGEPVDLAAAERLLLPALTPGQRRLFEENGEIDFAYAIPGVGRARANIYRQHRGIDGTFRLIPPRPPSLEELGLPSALAKLTNHHRGMVLVNGPAGCGKSSTMAALLDILNEERTEHILTVEDPVEYVHRSKRALVNQRQVNRHTESFARALRAALREDPDVIAIGELRDLETIGLALTAAETGHFVLGTLHTASAIRTINRLIGAFPPSQQDQIRTMVSESLRAIVSQKLIPRADGQGRVPALEILVVNKAAGNLIRENKTFQLHSILQTGATQGMCLMDESLAALVRSGEITQEEALRNCEDPKRFGG